MMPGLHAFKTCYICCDALYYFALELWGLKTAVLGLIQYKGRSDDGYGGYQAPAAAGARRSLPGAGTHSAFAVQMDQVSQCFWSQRDVSEGSVLLGELSPCRKRGCGVTRWHRGRLQGCFKWSQGPPVFLRLMGSLGLSLATSSPSTAPSLPLSTSRPCSYLWVLRRRRPRVVSSSCIQDVEHLYAAPALSLFIDSWRMVKIQISVISNVLQDSCTNLGMM